jgi:hypothetical protein
LSPSELRKLAEFTNDDHDTRSIHATYFERLKHVADVLDKHTSANGRVNFNNLSKEFVGTWYKSIETLKKCATIIKAFKTRPSVSI